VALPETFQARLISVRTLSPSVRELTFERADGAPLAFVPGQWVNVLTEPPSPELKRAYSIASPPSNTSRFDLAVTRVLGGPMSETLHAMQTGTCVRVIGPSGFFTREADDPTASIFVGTGTGFTPFRSMVGAALAAGSSAPMWILFGVRHEEDILYRDELDAWGRANPNVRVFITLSQPAEGWAGRRGYVQHHLPEIWAALGDPAANVYVCGLERMVKAVRELARGTLGIGRKQVHQERYD
jgi:ferredoxin-NADP reductase